MSDNLAVNFEGPAYVVERIVIRLLIYIIILPLLYKFVRPRFRKLVDTLDKEWRAAVFVPLMFLMMQVMVLYYPTPYWHWGDENWYRVIIITVYMLFLTVYYLIYIQASDIVEKYALENRQLLMAQQEKLWEAELSRQKQASELVFQQRHDLHHHNALILELLQNGNIEQLISYMKSNSATYSEPGANTYCTNPIVNSLFNAYARRAAEEGVEMTFHVCVPEFIGIEHVDLTCIFGNTLENALEGCLRVTGDEKKEIIVTAKFIDKRLRVQVENTCRTDIVFDGELPITQKQVGGTGTKSIIYTAERYDGTAGFSVKDGKFITQIVLNGH